VDSRDELIEMTCQFTNSPLRSLTLNYRRPNVPNLDDIAENLVQFKTLTSLTIIQMDGLLAEEPLRAKGIKTLFALKNLEVFNAAVYSGSKLNDELLGEMVRAWPKLTALWLPAPEEGQRRTLLTPACFESIARYGVNLGTLGIVVDTSEYDLGTSCPFSNEDGTPLQNSSLLHVVLDDATRRRKELGDFLSKVFPNIRKFESYSALVGDLDFEGSIERSRQFCTMIWELQR